MRVRSDLLPTGVRFRFEPDEDEPTQTGKARIARMSAEVAVRLQSEPHPDLLALCAFLIAGPFSKRMHFAGGMSSELRGALAYARGKEFANADNVISSRVMPDDGIPGLCFSGGVDSTASIELMPQNTELFFLKRVSPDGTDPHKLPEAAERIMQRLSQEGRHCYAVETDLEYVRKPVGFPDHMAVAVPLLLMADQRRLDSVGFGTIAESSYRFGEMGYTEYAERTYFKKYERLFSAVGISHFIPTAGMSEVATSRMMLETRFGKIAQPCARGGIEPCMECAKCFRKSLLDAALTGQWPEDAALDRFFDLPVIEKTVGKRPIHHENVYLYAMSRYSGESRRMLDFKRMLDTSRPTDWMTRYIPASLDLVPGKYRTELREKLHRYAAPMSPSDLAIAKGWKPATDGARAV